MRETKWESQSRSGKRSNAICIALRSCCALFRFTQWAFAAIVRFAGPVERLECAALHGRARILPWIVPDDLGPFGRWICRAEIESCLPEAFHLISDGTGHSSGASV